MTVEQTLSHQAGFDGDHLFVNRVPEGLDALRDARRLFPPGAGFSYNNAGILDRGCRDRSRVRTTVRVVRAQTPPEAPRVDVGVLPCG